MLPLVLVSLDVHPYQEVLEDPGPPFHQECQVGLQHLLNLLILVNPVALMHLLFLVNLLVQEDLFLL